MHFFRRIGKAGIWADRRGQDLIEYALMSGFLAGSVIAFMPGVTDSIHIVYSMVNSLMIVVAN